MRDDEKRLFQFAPDPDRSRDKSGSTHQAITDAGVALAEAVAVHVPDASVRSAIVVDIAAAVQRAHEAVDRGTFPMTVGQEVKAAAVSAPLDPPPAEPVPPVEPVVSEPEPELETSEPVADDAAPTRTRRSRK